MSKSEHYLYDTWKGMRQRCSNPSHQAFSRYGGRGIKVCPEWDNFWTFVEDMGERPEGHTLERIDNNKGYSRGNCRWATRKEQAENMRPPASSIKPTAKGYSKLPNGRYRAVIKIDGKHHHLGVFNCPLMAHLAFKDAQKRKLRASSTSSLKRICEFECAFGFLF